MRLKTGLFAATAFALALPGVARADEGMWTFDAFPAERMKAAYGFAPNPAWLDRTRAGAVRLTGGCSASFVSPEGLILTNHHCIVTCLSDNSNAADDLVANGFVAAGRTAERKCAGQQAEVVTGITDVTADVRAAIGTLTGEAATRARDARIAQIEQAAGCTDANARCQVVRLFGGGQFKLYRYKTYSDVRVAWAPALSSAFFGGDPDNFNFPRFALDAAFLRAYENDKPAATPAHLKWNPREPVDGEATFVVGNPGSTQRSFTAEQLAFERELALPTALAVNSELRGRLIRAMAESLDKRREGEDLLFGIENSLKVTIGRHRALNDQAFNARLAAAEADFKAKAAGQANLGDPWGEIATAVKARRDFFLAQRFINPSSDLYAYARTLVRAAAERGKPNAERLPGFTESSLPLLERSLLAERPITPWIEQLRLEWSLSKAREYLGADDPQTKLMLGRESPEQRAARLVSGTRLADPAVRRQLWEGGAAAIAASTDPMIVYARELDARDRELTRLFNERFDAPVQAAQARLASARFAAYGDSVYPDATFTLRISYGQVKGWTERGNQVPTRTRIAGLFDRATGAEPFKLPAAFEKNQARIDRNVTYNFVTTNDIIGGNSGSPVLDRAGTVIGTAFDGNIHSLGGNYGYDPELNRTVVASAAAVQEALKNIYPAPALLAELNRGNRGSRRR
jgi:hypothetical protein